ncbi:hypothetical protein PC116_g31345 [Phytophthora cactorum]|nr:hypothetical protein PC116_g31345 [Phytophthora cactorum]
MIGRVQSVGDWMHQMIGCRLGSEDSVSSDQSITFESSFYPSSVFAPVPPSATSLPPPHTSFVSKIHTFHQISSDAATKVNAPFREAVGALMHLMTATRPDIAYAVGYVSRFMENPQEEHWVAVKRIFRYLQGTKTHGICFKPGDNIDFRGYSDADWAGDLADRKSTSGYTFMLMGAPVSWGSKKQSSVSLSTSEAEYIALSLAIQEGKWIHRLLCEILAATNETGPELKIREDNQSCIKMTKNPVNHGRAKHIDIKYHHIRDEVKRGEVKLEYCETSLMLADIMTKALPGPRHMDLTTALGIHACSH